jgi:hypothetical protein
MRAVGANRLGCAGRLIANAGTRSFPTRARIRGGKAARGASHPDGGFGYHLSVAVPVT